MDTAKVYIFSSEGKPSTSSLSDLKGKRVGARQGMPYGKEVENSIELLRVRSIKENVKALKKGSIDYFIAYVPDAYQTFRDLKMEPLPM